MTDFGIHVAGLYTYPVKSCAGIALSTAEVTPRGLEHDRDFMLVDDAGNYLSQRQIPEMALVVPKIGEKALTLSAPNIEDIEIPFELEDDDTQLVHANVHKKPIDGQVVSTDLNEWFTETLPQYKDSKGYRLLKVRDDKPRFIPEQYRQAGATNQVGFADGYSMLLTSRASLQALNRELAEPKRMNRFRPNIVIDAIGLAPHEEDYWSEVRIGQMSAFIVKACDRCAIPDTDQQTAKVSSDVRVALAQTRKGSNAHDPTNKGVFFGQNLVHVFEPGLQISMGEPIRVIGRNAEPNVVLRKRA